MENAGDVFQQAVADGERGERAQQGADGAADAATAGCGDRRVDVSGRRERDSGSPARRHSDPSQQPASDRQPAADGDTATDR